MGDLAILRFMYIKYFDLRLISFRRKDFNKMKIYFYFSFLNINSECKIFEGFNFTKLSTFKFAGTVSYSLNTCPLIFSFYDLYFLEFYGLSNTFIKTNILGFQSIQNTSHLYKIKGLNFYIYKADLTTQLFEYNLLNNIESITIQGIWKSADKNLFSMFKSQIVYIVIEDIPSVFNDGGDWLSSFKLMSNLTEFLEVRLEIFPSTYTFPNDDFCFYVNVPNNRNFLLSVFLDEYLVDFKCTCTMILFFGTYYNLLNTSFKFKKNSYSSWQFDSLTEKGCFNKTFIESCHIDSRRQKCKIYDKKTFFSRNKIIEDSQHIDFVSSIISEIISIVGLLTNILNMLVLFPTSKNLQIKKEMSKILYKLMLSNSLINFVYYLINIFHIMNKCVEANGILCPKIYFNILVQYFDIYFVEFFGSILKLWSGLTFIGISITRLDLISSNKLKNKEKSIKVILIIFFILTFSLNLDKLFNLVVNRDYYFLTTDTDEEAEFPMRNTFFSNMEVNNINLASNIIYSGLISKIFYSLFVINFVLNDIIYFFILTFFDLALWKKLIDQIKEKRILLKRMSLDSNISKAENIEIRVTIVLFFNAFFLFVFRGLHFGINIYLFIIKSRSVSSKENLCVNYGKICTNYHEAAELFNLLSNSYNVILFYFLNNNFKILLKKLFKK
ncbi:unnamed protein product [Brachionus calyciflorus]|uniref:Uncharacterized protein n=1 Tax=Brachionus calyciflorus TaxID=104777 RepID=A0A813RQJ6_9BILA|nr:unnamed protein product [Brachionus calyciflorus]